MKSRKIGGEIFPFWEKVVAAASPDGDMSLREADKAAPLVRTRKEV